MVSGSTKQKPGTLVSISLSDTYKIVGVVVDDCMADQGPYDTRRKQLVSKSDDYCVYLVLGNFPKGGQHWSIFGHDAFPCYCISECRYVRPLDLSREFALCRSYKEEVSANDPNFFGLRINLREEIFGFSPHQLETLLLAALVQQYLDGPADDVYTHEGAEYALPDWIEKTFELAHGRALMFFPILRKAIKQ